jgi:hypothetical protein
MRPRVVIRSRQFGIIRYHRMVPVANLIIRSDD